MIEISMAFIVSAFVAGVLMFLAPCTLPLVPAYLAFISGTQKRDFDDPETKKAAKRSIFYNSVAFVVGFSVVFIGFGVLAGALGSHIGQYRGVLAQIGGAIIILFGVSMTGIFDIPLLKHEYKVRLPQHVTPGHPTTSFLIGTIFALGWTPCVGPVLATVLLLATDSETVWEGGLMLAVFSLGLAVPFLVTAIAYAKAEHYIARYAYVSATILKVGGVFLIFVGVLLMTENFGWLLIHGQKLFHTLHLDFLYDYL